MDVPPLLARVLMPPKAYFFEGVVYFTHDGESYHKRFMDHEASAADSILGAWCFEPGGRGFHRSGASQYQPLRGP
jgi:hypothetical protein